MCQEEPQLLGVPIKLHPEQRGFLAPSPCRKDPPLPAPLSAGLILAAAAAGLAKVLVVVAVGNTLPSLEVAGGGRASRSATLARALPEVLESLRHKFHHLLHYPVDLIVLSGCLFFQLF